jgi:hypothetical protein
MFLFRRPYVLTRTGEFDETSNFSYVCIYMYEYMCTRMYVYVYIRAYIYYV